LNLTIAMSRYKDNEDNEDNKDTLTIDFPELLEERNIEADGLEEDFLNVEELVLSEPDTVEPYCKPEPPLPVDSATEEKRSYPRFLVNWKVVVVTENNGKQQIFHGRAYDISMGGLCLLSDDNLTFTDSFTVLVSVPPDSAMHKPYVLEVRSKIGYTVLASDVRKFRIGIRFIEFKNDGKRYLEQHFSGRSEVFS